LLLQLLLSVCSVQHIGAPALVNYREALRIKIPAILERAELLGPVCGDIEVALQEVLNCAELRVPWNAVEVAAPLEVICVCSACVWIDMKHLIERSYRSEIFIEPMHYMIERTSF
jgi:hypothetical protein